MGGKRRPTWDKRVRAEVKRQQRGLCAHCDKPLNRVFDVHHDYKGATWSEVRDIVQSDDMKALGITGKIARAVTKDMYHHKDSLSAVHPHCHVAVDSLQYENKLEAKRKEKA